MPAILREVSAWLLAAAAAVLPAAAIGAPPWAAAISGSNAGGPPATVTAEIVSPADAAVPGGTYRIGVLMKHREGWHTYWHFPGDTGYSTTVTWSAPEGWTMESLGSPVPRRSVTGGITSFEYGGEVLLPYEVKVPAAAAGAEIPVSAKIEFLACSNICVPGEANASFIISTAPSAKPSAHAPLFERTLAALPAAGLPERVAAVLQGDVLSINLPAGTVKSEADFYPSAFGQVVLREGSQFRKNPDGSASVILKAHKKLMEDPLLAVSGLLLIDGGPAKGGQAFETGISLEVRAGAPAEAAATPSETGVSSVTDSPPAFAAGTAAALLFAFLGGLILNVMPCVFPVITLKILQLVSGPKSRGALLAHGAAFTAGILACMLALAAVLLGVRSLGTAAGWGFQLQSPTVVTVLMLLFVAITLNLAGVYEFTAGSSLAGSRALRRLPAGGVAGSFFTGMLAVVVASPCTAPFMGAAIGYAVTQDPAESVLVFLALGAGMALPWFLLTAFPFWTRWLPKPGAWMVVFRKIMAVPLAAAALWLFWVLSRQVNTEGLVTAAAAALLAAAFCRTLGKLQYGEAPRPFALAGTALLCLASVFLIASGNFDQKSVSSDPQWAEWSPGAVSEAVSRRQPVIVDFTAAWCVTCQFNKASAIRTGSSMATMDRLGYARFEADWTNRDERISGELARHGRTGVPLYLLYDRSGTVTVLPELLTESAFIRALEKNAAK